MELYQLVWGEGDGERRELVKISTRSLGPPRPPLKSVPTPTQALQLWGGRWVPVMQLPRAGHTRAREGGESAVWASKPNFAVVQIVPRGRHSFVSPLIRREPHLVSEVYRITASLNMPRVPGPLASSRWQRSRCKGGNSADCCSLALPALSEPLELKQGQRPPLAILAGVSESARGCLAGAGGRIPSESPIAREKSRKTPTKPSQLGPQAGEGRRLAWTHPGQRLLPPGKTLLVGAPGWALLCSALCSRPGQL